MNVHFDNQFQPKRNIDYSSRPKGMTSLIMRLSFIQTEKQANMVLLGIVIVAFSLSIFYFSKLSKEPEVIINQGEILTINNH